MKILIVAKTRRGAGACVGGITAEGRSVRLIAHDAPTNERAGLEYEVGDVWEIQTEEASDITPPHVEDILVHSGKRLRNSSKLVETVHRFMTPVKGSPELLFDGLAQATSSGALYISRETELPGRSTMFWVPDRPLRLDCSGKRIHYRYTDETATRTLTFVGFQEPIKEIPAGTLLRVSLAHWWRPSDRPDEELRCFVQLSGWIVDPENLMEKPRHPAAANADTARPGADGAACIHQARMSEVLKQTFGFSNFLPLQEEIIRRILRGEDTLAVMPTGGGKSLSYQLPALLRDGLTVVVSPLVALMQDQVAQLAQADVPAACLNHLIPHREYASRMRDAREGRIKLLYLAPETLLRPEILLLLEQSRVTCLAIDEAHCISEWGHDFRPEYRQLAGLRERFPKVARVALTATATERVRKDIRQQLDIPAEGEFVSSFNRKNLFLAVEARRDRLAQALAFLESRRGQSGIIYCGTRKQADELCAGLKANGWPALPYHAGMEGADRQRNQERFLSDEVPLMVATVAFGMGINKSNVRFVIHAHLPKDLESYYQEVGRAGRDGLPAECLLLYGRGDPVVHRHFINQGAAPQRAGREARLRAMLDFVETRKCRRQPLLGYFGESFREDCGACDNCARDGARLEMTDRTEQGRKFLSCVQATGQCFGAAHIAAVLRGSCAEKVRARSHDKLLEFGTGSELSLDAWQAVGDQLVQFGFLKRSLDFGGLSLTTAGWDVLNGQGRIQLPADERAAARQAAQTQGHDPVLFDELKELRTSLARDARVPSYVIFSDRALLEMATFKPGSDSELLAVNGVGEAKLAKYGPAFLEIIRRHREDGVAPRDPAPKPTVARVAGSRTQQIADFFADGQSIADIAVRCDVQPSTVIEHLQRFQETGGKLDGDRLLAESRLSEADRARVLQAFERHGAERLAPIYQEFSGTVPYVELHLLRACFLAALMKDNPPHGG
jgi:ATP-dependent DNA helicase RecQ